MAPLPLFSARVCVFFLRVFVSFLALFFHHGLPTSPASCTSGQNVVCGFWFADLNVDDYVFASCTSQLMVSSADGTQATALMLTAAMNNYFHPSQAWLRSLPCGVQVILGNNGYVWICPLPSEEGTKFFQSVDMVPEVTREAISRVRNCIVALARNHVLLFDTSIVYAFDISLEHKVNALTKPEVMKEVADLTKQKLFVEA
ncbi:hypothetical protein V5799_003090 [Amblyomma americanum]|uniref:K Homology domain-containing protein n=1 Tax=Amblyomma americanum TaxID=6943 RepID=A0AAQ4D9Y8_AMBAM